MLVIGGDGSSSSGCVDVGVGGNSGSSSHKCVSPAQQWKISSTSPLLIPKHTPWHHRRCNQSFSWIRLSVLAEVDGSASGIVGLLVVVSIEVSAAEDVLVVSVGLDASGTIGTSDSSKRHIGG